MPTKTEPIEDRGAIDRALRDRFGWTPYRLLAGAALASCGIVAFCDVLMWFLVDGYNPLGQTISELAAGPHHAIQDGGIVVFVVGILALVAGLVLRGTSDKLSWAVRGAFVLLTIDIGLIALWNEYGDGQPGGVEIHRYCVGLLYLLVAFLLWFATSVPPVRGKDLAKIGKITAVLWVVLAPLFYVMPDGIDGGYERLLAGIMIAAVAIAAYQLFRTPEGEA